MKVSEVDEMILAEYARLDDPSDIELNELKRMRESAVAMITAYTGLKEEELDEHADITQALFVLVMDMFDNRNLMIDYKSTNMNPAVKTILNLHSVNLL
jgi:NADH:ubiquinone oxidoreductase subunit C|nr:MAG TPA: tail connector protein [Caudoviricetes sp.]